MTVETEAHEDVASCGCGNLRVKTRGEPLEVYACSCLNCQRETGGAFTYSAVFPEAAGSIDGDSKVWRRQVESGRWLESGFCPTCGVTVYVRMEVWPEIIAVSVGCFADPDFARPEKVYFADRRHHWLEFPDGTELIESQPG